MSVLRRASILGLTLAAVTAVAAEPEGRSLTVLHTSDIHGWAVPFDDGRGEVTDHSLAHVARIVAEVRAEGRAVVVLDSGDTLQGTPFEALSHVRFGQPSPTIAAMNAIGYDAMALGNHDFNYGLEIIARAREQAGFPFLSANTVSSVSGEPAFAPFTVLEAAGVKIGVLGLVTSAIPNWERPEHYRGLTFLPPPEVAPRWVTRLREEEGCDLVVVLLHSGFERDLDSGESTRREGEDFASRMTSVEGIDLLLTGHTHRSIPPRHVGGMIVSQPRSRARVVTRLDLELEADGDGWRLRGWSGRNLTTAGVEPDPALIRNLSAARAKVDAFLDEAVTEATTAVSVEGCRLTDCAATDLIHQAQLEASGADLSLASILSDRTPPLAPGPLRWRWLHALYVYPNTLATVVLTGAQVKDVLEHAARFYDGLDCAPPAAGCTVLTDPAIELYNVDTMAGVSYRIDPARAEGDRVLDLRFHGEPIDLHRRFTLACNNYRRAGGGGYPHLTEAAVEWVSSAEVTDLLAEFLRRRRPWRPTADHNWEIRSEMDGEKPLSDGR